jgi:ribose-phosphate pyrophosphokinase
MTARAIPQLLHFDDERQLARRVGRAAGLAPARVVRHRFPDSEIRITLPARVTPRAVVLRSLHQPNEKLVELLLVAQTARELGARHVTLVAPYLPYMRQDIAFTPGEAVSQRHVGAFLAALFDRVIAVDPHLHRVGALADVLPEAEAIAATAAPLIGRFLKRRARGALLLGPDAEAAQWVSAAAAEAAADWAVCRKERRGDRRVTVTLPSIRFDGRAVVLVDDVISTGRTLVEAARAARRAGATRVDVAVTHALCADGAVEALRAAGVGRIWSTDSVAHETNAIPIAPLVAAALRRRARG